MNLSVLISFFIVCTILGVLLLFYFNTRLLRPANLKPWPRILAWFFLLFCLFMTPLNILLRKYGYENNGLDLLVWCGYFSMGFMALVLVMMIGRDLFLAVWLLTPIKSESFNPGRRFFLNNINNLIMVGSGGLTLAGLYGARRMPRIKSVHVKIPHLPQGLKGFTIAQITDLHIGSTIKRNWVATVVEQTNQINADIVVLTGDLADGSVRRLRHDATPLLRLKARYGCFFVTGNHDYYSNAPEWIVAVKQLGFTVLMNEHHLLHHGGTRLLLAGVTDFRAGDFDPEHASDPHKAIINAPQSDLKILLAHQPKSIFAAATAGFDLQISGHTHGGQFIPWNYAVSLDQPYTAGLHQYKNTRIYVSQGTGYWGPPLRLGTVSEITRLVLV